MLANVGLLGILLAIATGLGALMLKHPRVFVKIMWPLLGLCLLCSLIVGAYFMGITVALSEASALVGAEKFGVMQQLRETLVPMAWWISIQLGALGYLFALGIFALLIVQDADAKKRGEI